MKLIVAGATGFVGQEVIRQSLRNPDIKSVVALTRRPVTAPAGTDASKLKNVVVKDYDQYPDEVKKEFAEADACIWTVAITPMKSKKFSFDEVTRVCQTSPLVGLNAMHSAGLSRPFRFLYVSGEGAERDQSKKPSFLGQYLLMRGETENRVLAFAAEHSAEGFEVCVAKPGLISNSLATTVLGAVIKFTGFSSVSLQEVSAALLTQVTRGIEKETLESADLLRIGQKALKA
ncbi:Succinate-semialdehyde dehydrogenase [Mycena sanguinolenta]|uniref:Succinate-semialdehyde dehydrogenase n=1 Tax=Mycena sanguinolenta TaxID=230812 RepID=A0A8H6ZBM4_9AGAR|nr:Succinate-semialdehyde dehydrogenase [Mycena sanguinolenta]